MDNAPMLRIATYVAPSPIAGMGLFSAVDLEPGEIVWEYLEGVDWKIPQEVFENFPDPYREWLSHYLYREDSGLLVLCGDSAKFMNHSDDPNCDDSGEQFTVARRRIRAGEELTCDYRAFDADSKRNGVVSFTTKTELLSA